MPDSPIGMPPKELQDGMGNRICKVQRALKRSLLANSLRSSCAQRSRTARPTRILPASPALASPSRPPPRGRTTAGIHRWGSWKARAPCGPWCPGWSAAQPGLTDRPCCADDRGFGAEVGSAIPAGRGERYVPHNHGAARQQAVSRRRRIRFWFQNIDKHTHTVPAAIAGSQQAASQRRHTPIMGQASAYYDGEPVPQTSGGSFQVYRWGAVTTQHQTKQGLLTRPARKLFRGRRRKGAQQSDALPCRRMRRTSPGTDMGFVGHQSGPLPYAHRAAGCARGTRPG